MPKRTRDVWVTTEYLDFFLFISVDYFKYDIS